MLIKRRGAKRPHRDNIVAHRPRAAPWPGGTNWAFFECTGRSGVTDRGTTHTYTVALSREEILKALEAMLGESSHPKARKPMGTLLRELLAAKK